MAMSKDVIMKTEFGLKLEQHGMDEEFFFTEMRKLIVSGKNEVVKKDLIVGGLVAHGNKIQRNDAPPNDSDKELRRHTLPELKEQNNE